MEADVGVISVEAKPKWPSDGLQQIRIVRVRQVLETLVATGAARTADEGGRSRYFVAR